MLSKDNNSWYVEFDITDKYNSNIEINFYLHLEEKSYRKEHSNALRSLDFQLIKSQFESMSSTHRYRDRLN